jgi:hypothetical protein
MEHTPIVTEVTKHHMEKTHRNVKRNDEMVLNYLKLLANGIVKKHLSPYEVHVIRQRKKRLENCNRFWSMETYEASHVRVLLRTFLCKDKFCSNCNQMKKILLQKRFLPYMEKYKDSMYHMVLTVPDCDGEELRDTIQRMIYCFKTLITYLNGNKKVKGVDLLQYDFQGCIRSLEITYSGNLYHPHFHVAIVFGNNGIGKKHIANQFSGRQNRLFSDCESIIQRIWWLLINGKRLTSDNIFGKSDSLGRYSCIVDKFHPEDYKKLFGYMTKMYSECNSLMRYDNFKTLYYALSHIRQIQGYGVFYNIKELNTESYTEQEYQMLENYLVCKEKPICSYEPLSRLTDNERYIVLKTKHKNKI